LRFEEIRELVGGGLEVIGQLVVCQPNEEVVAGGITLD
jgi:hypothetical protein